MRQKHLEWSSKSKSQIPARLFLLMRLGFLLQKRRMVGLEVSCTLCKVEKSLRQLHLQQTTNLPFPFTYVLVEEVCFKVIFQGNQSEVSVRWRSGVDLSGTPIVTVDGKEIYMELNFGEGNTQEGQHACTMAKMHITSPLLVRVVGWQVTFWLIFLPTLTKKICSMSQKNPSQFIFDWHQRLDPKFVEYINDAFHC